MSNTFGSLLNDFRRDKSDSISREEDELLKRSGLDPRTYDRRLYQIITDNTELPSGRRAVELRLMKLIDATSITLGHEVTVDVKTGINSLGDFYSDPTHPLYIEEDEKELLNPKTEDKDW